MSSDARSGGRIPIEAPEVLVSVAERADEPELHLRALEDAAWTLLRLRERRAGRSNGSSELVEAIPATTHGGDPGGRGLAVLPQGHRTPAAAPEDSARIAALARSAGASHARRAVGPAGPVLRPLPGGRPGRRGRRPGRRHSRHRLGPVEARCRASPARFSRGVAEWEIGPGGDGSSGWESARSSGSSTSRATARASWPRSIASAGRLVDSEAEARTACGHRPGSVAGVAAGVGRRSATS